MADSQYDGLYVRPADIKPAGDLGTYNLNFYDYTVPALQDIGTPTSIHGIEWLVVACCIWRAKKIEEEIPPQADYIKYRSDCMEECGKALATASAAEASVKGDLNTETSPPPKEVYDAVNKYTSFGPDFPTEKPTKGDIQKACQHLRNAIDLMDNDAQTDNTRLQSLLEKRNSAFNSASEFMTKINSNLSMGISILAS